MTFKTVAVITSIVTGILGIGYLLAGDIVIGRWQIEISSGVMLMGRRIGAVYCGLAAIFFLARSAEASATRTAIVLGAAIALSLLVIVGLAEYLAHHVGAGILASVAIEALLAICYFWIFIGDRRNPVSAKM